MRYFLLLCCLLISGPLRAAILSQETEKSSLICAKIYAHSQAVIPILKVGVNSSFVLCYTNADMNLLELNDQQKVINRYTGLTSLPTEQTPLTFFPESVIKDKVKLANMTSKDLVTIILLSSDDKRRETIRVLNQKGDLNFDFER